MEAGERRLPGRADDGRMRRTGVCGAFVSLAAARTVSRWVLMARGGLWRELLAAEAAEDGRVRERLGLGLACVGSGAVVSLAAAWTASRRVSAATAAAAAARSGMLALCTTAHPSAPIGPLPRSIHSPRLTPAYPPMRGSQREPPSGGCAPAGPPWCERRRRAQRTSHETRGRGRWWWWRRRTVVRVRVRTRVDRRVAAAAAPPQRLQCVGLGLERWTPSKRLFLEECLHCGRAACGVATRCCSPPALLRSRQLGTER
jgi:hypothetical protein